MGLGFAVVYSGRFGGTQFLQRTSLFSGAARAAALAAPEKSEILWRANALQDQPLLLLERHRGGHIPAQLRILPVELDRDGIGDITLFVFAKRADATDGAVQIEVGQGI